MYAVVKTGGKQYRVVPGDVIRVEKLAAEAGTLIELDQVLMLGGADSAIQVGTPRIEGAAVSAAVLEQLRDDTVLVFKKKRRHNYRRKKGHRQHLTVLRIAEILPPGAPRTVTLKDLKPARPKKQPIVAQAQVANDAAEDGAKPVAKKAAPKKSPPHKAAPHKAQPKRAEPKKSAPAKKAKSAAAAKSGAKTSGAKSGAKGKSAGKTKK
jgi:large subunit ribosomal protein L21